MDTSIQGIPVSIITGFLGSGKTTLLNQILTQQQGLKIAVLVNEFGEIGIDNELIISSDDDIVELNNGCICCTINEELVKTVHKILERKEKIDYLIVETTGVADPLPIAGTFLSTELRGKTRLDSIITLVDCDNFYAKTKEESIAAKQQITCGDVILLNKTDLVKSQVVKQIEDKIRQQRPNARILRTVKANVALSLILSVGLFKSDRYFQEEISHFHHHEHHNEHHHHEHSHEHHHHHSDHIDEDSFSSLSFETEKLLDIRKFQYFLDNQLPESVFRAKGILWLKGSTARHIFHLSGKRFGIEDDEWKGMPKNQLVFIGQNLEQDKLRALLEACVC
ncbi:putative GTPase, G3E family [Xenococcus sp. PCC 7305]|uniref:CobW family GTP-binding protein n=1 Tax=Xenococcus sp. PCC 7305 TaxID=102125 RepID=UPI0002ACBE3D|nr:GTP-binding protein [Xenococcus sp. PCC 7305]ELS04533.1 putative GTPase, G3E family [Xenococcus sp. PCC 7305]